MKKAVTEIIVPERRREELGDLAGLATSIEKYGLIHPIVIDETGTLVAGERRLEACKRLGWTEVEVRSHGELTEKERWAIELEENLRRKDLTTPEYQKNMQRLAEQARAIITEKKAEESIPTQTNGVSNTVLKTSSKGGRPRKHEEASQAEVADALGVSTMTISRNEQYTDAIEKYPEIATTPGVPLVDGITIAKTLDTLPEDVREQKRLALQAGQRNILADLTGRPPLPEPNGHDQYAQQEIKWHKTLGHLTTVIKGLEDQGFLQHLLVHWSLETKQAQAIAFRKATTTFAHVTDLIQSSIDAEEPTHAGS